MKTKFVIDTSDYITYAAYNNIYRLIYAINPYDLQIYINEKIIRFNLMQALKLRRSEMLVETL